MDTFEKDIFGEVPCSEFIAQFKGVLDREDKEEGEKAVVDANRYFATIEDIFKEIAFEIQSRHIKDFGSFLKGNLFTSEEKGMLDDDTKIVGTTWKKLKDPDNGGAMKHNYQEQPWFKPFKKIKRGDVEK